MTADANDNVGVTGVQFLVDGATRPDAEDTNAPYALSWDTRTVANGAHTLTARARDAAGNTHHLGAGQRQRRQRRLLPERDPGDRVRPADDVRVPAGRPHARRRAPGQDQGPAAAVHPAGSGPVPADHQHRLGRRPAGHLRPRARPELRDQPLLLRLLHARLAQSRPRVAVHRQRGADGHRARGASSSSTRTRRTRTPSTMAARSTSPTTASCCSRPASTSFRRCRSGSPTRGARCTGSTRTARCRPTTRSTTGPARTSTPSGPAACATRSAPTTTRRPAATTSATSAATIAVDRDRGDQPRRRRAPTTAGPTARARARPRAQSPLFSYAHDGRDAAITGGFVYHGTQFPSSYRGAYFYADYAQNWIRGLRFDANGAVTGTFNFEPPNGAADGPYGDIVYLAEGPDGALYYVDLGYSDVGGTFGVSKIRRIRYVQSNQAPVVNASANSDLRPGAAERRVLERRLVRPRGPAAHLLVELRRRGHLDRGQPLTHLHHRRHLPGAADGL